VDQQALERIRAEYREMPGMRLTPEQVERLSGADRSVCSQVVDALVNAQFLCLGIDGSYTRAVDGRPSRLRNATAEGSDSVRRPTLRHAG
jgi:hypothetical protein